MYVYGVQHSTHPKKILESCKLYTNYCYDKKYNFLKKCSIIYLYRLLKITTGLFIWGSVITNILMAITTNYDFEVI